MTLRRGLVLLLCAALGVASLCACASGPRQMQVWAYDTLCTATVWGGGDVESVFVAAAKEGETLLNETGGKSYTASADGESISVGDEMARILRMAEFLHLATDGVFDLSVAPLSALWDVGHATTPPSEDAIRQALSLVDASGLSLKENTLTFRSAGMGIDVGSVGKGYGAQLTAEALARAGAEGGVVSFGGNVALFGTKNGEPFRIGIRDPKGTSADYFGILTATDVSVVTSGAYERYFEADGVRYHHLLDANTGYPRISDLLSVTVVCTDGAQADLTATALWLLGGERGEALFRTLSDHPLFESFEVIFVYNDGTVFVSDGLLDRFQLTGEGYTLREAP